MDRTIVNKKVPYYGESPFVRDGDLKPDDLDQNGGRYEILTTTEKSITFRNSVGVFTVRRTTLVRLYSPCKLLNGSDIEAAIALKNLNWNKKQEKRL